MVKNEGRIKEAIAYYSWRNVNLEKTFGQEYLLYKSKINIYIPGVTK